MHLLSLLMLGTALGVSAHPSDLSPKHHALFEKRAPAFFKATHQLIAKDTATSSGTSSDARVPFCSETGNSRRATQAQVAYAGNTGQDNGCAWGSNLMLVNENIANKYDYSIKFTNVDSERYQVVCFNKIGPTGEVNGFWYSALNFTLAPQEVKHLAVDENSQGGCAWGVNQIQKTTYGEPAGVWGEFDFGNLSNKKWSGADCSSLVSSSAGLDIPGCQMCFNNKCSTIFKGGKGDNAFTSGTQNQDGLGLNISPGKVAIDAKVGYSGQ